MRKQVYLAALAVVSLVSCQHEKSFNGGSDANEVAFALRSSATRSAETASPVETGISISLGKRDGRELFLEETIVNLNDYAPETKGAPVYTENVGYLYQDQLGVHTDSAGGVDATYSRLTDKTDDGWAYQHRYNVNIWPDEKTDVQFYLYMPTNMTSNGVSSMTYNNGVATIEYTSPSTAAAQEDIIFGGVKMNHKKYMGQFYPQGAPVTIYHALTGVKFAIKNTDAELAKIQINKISFIGLKNTGTVTFNAASPSATAFNWDATATANNVIYQTYQAGDLVTYDATTHAGNNFADSFFDAGTVNNLNKADASYTFWLIPQGSIQSSSAVLKIEYTMSGVNEYMEINLKDLSTSDWQPGQIRTYTFKLNEVNLMIADEVELDGDASDGFEGSVKSEVTITNTGNTRAFIRAALVGQWLDYKDDPVFGFTDAVKELHLVASWYEDQFGSDPQYDQGEFDGLPGYGTTPNPYNGWQLCDDGYYYYLTAVEPGASTTDLFETYTVGTIPNAELAGAVIDNTTMHFTLEIATQAIAANQLNGLADSWDNAWEKALGKKPVKK